MSSLDFPIPKRIMQTWKNKTVPEHWASSPKSIREFQPDWKYRLMTDEDNLKLVSEHFPDFLPYFLGFPYGIQRADAIRYCYLYLYGGVYMDLDFECRRPLDSLFKEQIDSEIYLVNNSNIGKCVTNSFMASKAKSPFWLEVIEEMKKPIPWWAFGKHMQVMQSTGPMMLDRVYRRHLDSGVISILPTEQILPFDICDVCQNKEPGPESFMKQLEGHSWISYDTRFYNYMFCHWRQVVFYCLIFLIFALVLFLYFNSRKRKEDRGRGRK